jgi:hypothetical protein
MDTDSSSALSLPSDDQYGLHDIPGAQSEQEEEFRSEEPDPADHDSDEEERQMYPVLDLPKLEAAVLKLTLGCKVGSRAARTIEWRRAVR